MSFIKLSNIPTAPIISAILFGSLGILYMDESSLAVPSIVTYVSGVVIYKVSQRALAWYTEEDKTQEYIKDDSDALISSLRAMLTVFPAGSVALCKICSLNQASPWKSYGTNDIEDYGGISYIFTQVMLALLITDFFFYWLHRLQHSSSLWVHHKEHHRFITNDNMTLYAGEAQSVAEILFEGIFCVWCPSLFIPMWYPISAWLMPVLFALWTTSQHSASSMHIPGGIINDRTRHHAHHAYGKKNGNFSFYFTHWDKLVGTVVNLPKSRTKN